MRGRWATALLGCWMLTGGAACPSTAPLDFCEAILAVEDRPQTEADLRAVHEAAREAKIPGLDGVHTDLIADESQVYFAANLDLTTLEEPPLERHYRVLYGPAIFDDPMSHAALAAVLLHENKHLLDYAGMDSDELAEFALWYGTTEDVSDYERETDEFVLECGCGLALIEFREWLYAQVDEETLQQKRHDYYTPEEIEAWMEEHR